MTEMIERVAQAIADEYLKHFGALSMDIRSRMARAAIEAMREPTAEMWDAGEQYCDEWSPNYVWNAMIDAALGVQSSP